MASVANLEKALLSTKEQESSIRSELARKRSNMSIPCPSCGHKNKFKDIILVNLQYYVQPYGCTGGAYWTHDEYNFDCNSCGIKIRPLFNTDYKVSWDKSDSRREATTAFWRIFSRLVKDIQTEYPDENRCILGPRRKFVNSYYADENLKRFIGASAFAELVEKFDDEHLVITRKPK